MTTRPRRPNQADIAEQLGVSVSTVSRALAEDGGISASVRAEVHRLAKSLGYRGKSAQPVPEAQRRAVALVPLIRASGGIVASGFYEGVVDGIREAAVTEGINVDFRIISDPQTILEQAQRHLRQAEASSLLIAGIDPSDEFIDWAQDNEVALVLVNGTDPKMRVSSVSPSNFYGAQLAAHHLLAAGHRRIVHYTYQNRHTIYERTRGFEAAVAEVKGAEAIMVKPAETSPAELCKELIAGKYGATALFCMNDLLAVEVLEGLNADQACLPEGFSVVGFDDLPCAAMVSPRLSTIHVDREAIGRGAVHLLRQQLGGNDVVQELKVGLSWIEGGTLHQLAGKSTSAKGSALAATR